MFSSTHKNGSLRRLATTKRHSSAALPPLQSTKLLDQLPERIRYLHWSLRTEESYLYWTQFFFRGSGMRLPEN